MGKSDDHKNIQTLCGICDRAKNQDVIDFRGTRCGFPYRKGPVLLPRHKLEYLRLSLTRLVNFFYRCRAVAEVRIDGENSGRNYSLWEVALHYGNNPEWLLGWKTELLNHVQTEFECPQVEDIQILNF